MRVLQGESIQGGLDHGLQRLVGPPVVAASTHTHMCVSQKKCRVEPEDQELPGVWQTKRCCEHTHVCFTKTIQGCTQGSKVTRDWPNNCS